LNAKRYYSLNQTAMVIWHALEQEEGTDAVVKRLARDFDVTPEDATASLKRLVAELRTRGVLTASE